jgi:cytochrome c-type biogenesis protein CcmE
MKKSHLLLIIAMAACVSILISTTQSSSEYANISQASLNQNSEYTVVGNLDKTRPIEYNPQLNPNLVTFYMKDKEGTQFKVVLNGSKPQDMEKSEDVVVKGRFKNDTFYANTILLKCPSKYAEQNQFNQAAS